MLKHVIMVLACAVFMVFLSCESGDDDDNILDPQSAEAKVEEANDSLASVLFELINNEDIEHPDEIDFSIPNQLYKEALALDSDNLDANFGAGLTEMLMIFVDPQVNDAFDEWKSFIDSTAIFEPPEDGPGLNLKSPSELFSVSPHLLSSYSAGIFKMSLTDPPMISSIQDIVEDEVFPRVTYAIGKLNVIAANSGYTFTITPQMQGDETEDEVEIDLTEIHVALAELYLIKSIGNIFLSYNFDFTSYDSVGLYNAIQQNSSFLDLKTGGASDMASAKTSFLSAVDKIEDAINFLQNETDNQDDDLIIIGEDDINEDDLDSLLTRLPDIRDAINDSYDLTEDFNNDGNDQTITISLGALFDNPIDNLKQMLPNYSAIIVRDSSMHSWYDWHGDSMVYEIEYYHYSAIITWEAQSFAEWIFPYPTFNGFLPGMTDTEFKNTFGITEEDWEQEIKIRFD